MEEKICTACGKRWPADAAFCGACGKPLTTPDTAYVAAEPAPPQKRSNKNLKWILKTVRTSLVALAALIALIFSFLPVVSVSAEITIPDINEEVEVEMNFSGIDSIALLTSSFVSYDAKELKDTKIYAEIEEINDEIEDVLIEIIKDIDIYDYDDVEDALEDLVDGRLERLLSKLAYKMVIAQLMTEGVRAPASYYFTAILSLVYILTATAAFALAVLSLLAHLGVIDGEARLTAWATRLITFVPVIAIALCSSMTLSYRDSSADVDACAGIVLTLVFSLTAIAYTAVERLIFTRNRNIKGMITKGVSIALSIFVIAFALAPIATAKIGRQSGTSIGYDASGFNLFGSVSDSQYEAWEEYNETAGTKGKKEYFKGLYEDLDSLKKSELRDSAGKTLNAKLVTTMIGINTGKGVSTLFSIFPLFFIGAIAFASLVMREGLMFFATGERRGKRLRIYKILSAAFALLSLTAAIILAAVMGNLAGSYMPSTYSFGMGYGAILLIIFSALLAASPSFDSEDIEDEDEEYAEYEAEAEVVEEAPLAPAETAKAPKETVKAPKETAKAPAPDIMASIEAVKALKQLLDMGAITEEEFAAKKAELLGI